MNLLLKISIHISISVIFVNLLLIEIDAQKLPCNKNTERNVDEKVAELFLIGNSTVKFPETQESALSYCQEFTPVFNYLENYRNSCLKNMSKQIMSILIYTGKNHFRQICKKNSKKLAELLRAAPCVNAASSQLGKCLRKAINDIQGVEHADHKLKIPMCCCLYQKSKDCVVEEGTKFKICNDEMIDIFTRYLDSLMGGAFNLACGEFGEDNDKCNSLVIPKRRKNQPRYKSLFIPVLKVLESFPEV